MAGVGAVRLAHRLLKWRQEHPKRDYAGSALEEAARGLPESLELQIAGRVYSRARSAGGTASGVHGAASNAPPFPAELYCAEVVCVPFSQVIPEGGGGVEAPAGRKNAARPHLYVYKDSASGDTRQHTTSIERILALAQTHPLVATINRVELRNLGGEERQVDKEGRATSGHQSLFDLSLGLAGTGKVFQVGLTTKNVRPELFALHWTPVGSGWSLGSWIAARSCFFDLVELEAGDLLREAYDARGDDPVPVAASGAAEPARPAFVVSLSDEEDSDQNEGGQEDEAKEGSDSSRSSDSAICAREEREGERGPAASGALPGGLAQSERQGMMSLEEKARAAQVSAPATALHHLDDSNVWVSRTAFANVRPRSRTCGGGACAGCFPCL